MVTAPLTVPLVPADHFGYVLDGGLTVDGALTVSSDYTVTVPDLAFERAHVDADTHATFVTVAGQNINELTAKTTYADRGCLAR